MKQVVDKVTLAIHRHRTKGKKVWIKNLLGNLERKQLVNLQEGYYIFRTVQIFQLI